MYKPICEDESCPLSPAAHYWTDLTMVMATSRGPEALSYVSGMRVALAIAELNPEYAKEITDYSNGAHEEGKAEVHGHAMSPHEIARRVLVLMPLRRD